ncbi:MAG: CAP domain-containing protein, partial [Clostridia bacterium]|nr:CAP domain-containing protein [Clostridia bacterium]
TDAADTVLGKINEARAEKGLEKLAYDPALCDVARHMCNAALAETEIDIMALISKRGLPCKRLWSYQKTCDPADFSNDYPNFAMTQDTYSHIGLAVLEHDGSQILAIITVARK